MTELYCIAHRKAMRPEFAQYSPVEFEAAAFDYFLRDMFASCDRNVSETTHANRAKPGYDVLCREIMHQCFTLRDREGTEHGGDRTDPDYTRMLIKAKYADFLLFRPELYYTYRPSVCRDFYVVVHFPPTMKKCCCQPQRDREETGSRFGVGHTSPVLYKIVVSGVREIKPLRRSVTFQQWLSVHGFAGIL